MKKGLYMRNRKRKAFTLTEILVSMLILGLIMGAVIGLFFAIVMHLEQSNDITTAQQRGEMVLTALGPRIMAAGLGMPETSGRLRRQIRNPVFDARFPFVAFRRRPERRRGIDGRLYHSDGSGRFGGNRPDIEAWTLPSS